MEKRIRLIINKSEITAGTRGASLGPEAVKVAARSLGKTLFKQFPTTELVDRNELLDDVPTYEHAKYIEGAIAIYNELQTAIKNCAAQGETPIVLAGDHGSAGGTIAGLKAAHPEKRIGVVWIDAHGDVHTPYTTPSGNIHGMPVAAALCIDNLDCKRNDLDEATIEQWETLKNVGYPGPKMDVKDIVFVAVRDTEPEEDFVIANQNIRSVTVEEVRQNGVDVVFEEIQDRLKDCDLVYVSFDVDSMDPIETSYGTGTPVDNGLLIDEARTLVQKLVALPNFGCFEMVEINPCLDEKKNKMADVSLTILETVIDTLKTV